jgi:hypothetical protein
VIGSRFWGNGEYVADNEAYGVILSFIASGDDLKHPDMDTEKARKAKLRNTVKAAAETGDSKDKKDAPPRATVTVSDENGAHIRTFTTDVHQGINRVTWNLHRDGLEPLPDVKTAEDADLPDGIEVIPGTYSISVAFDGQEQSVQARVLADPRIDVSMDSMRANQSMQLQLQTLEATANHALTQILTARRDLGTIETMIGQASDPQQHAALKEQVEANKDSLTDLESLLRNPKSAKGRPYTDDLALNTLTRAKSFLTSTYQEPSPTAMTFAKLAEKRVTDAVSAVNNYLENDFSELRSAFARSNLGLLTQGPVPLAAQ